MPKPFYVYWMCGLLLFALIGCAGGDKESGDKPSVQADSSTAEAKGGEQQMEYRAVCTEKEAHGGSEYVLSRWLEDKEKAAALGQYHGDFKYKGHRWRIEERVMPIRDKPK